MGNGAWVVVGVGIAVVVVVNLLVWVRPSFRPDPDEAPLSPRKGPASLGFLADSPARSLAVGFSHLFGPWGLPRRRHQLPDRMGRAMLRVDAVDPYEERRRVGMALVRAGLTAAPPPGRPGWGGPSEPRKSQESTARPDRDDQDDRDERDQNLTTKTVRDRAEEPR